MRLKRYQKKNYLQGLLLLKCPRCREGDLFQSPNPYRLKHLFSMHSHCPVCGQKTELELGFWYGTGYVSYALAVALSGFNLSWYWVLFGISWRDNSIYWWLITNTAILLLMFPWLLRLSRVIYLSFFVPYDPEAYPADHSGGIPGN